MCLGAILISARGGGLKDPPPVGDRVKNNETSLPPHQIELKHFLN